MLPPYVNSPCYKVAHAGNSTSSFSISAILHSCILCYSCFLSANILIMFLYIFCSPTTSSQCLPCMASLIKRKWNSQHVPPCGKGNLHKVAAPYFKVLCTIVQVYKEDWGILHMLGCWACFPEQ